MLATERTAVAEINKLARAHLVARGDLPRRSRTYRAPDDRRAIPLTIGDEVILRRNHRITQPDGTTIAVRNGMTGRVTATRRRSLTVELHTAHRTPGAPTTVALPATYVGEHVNYGYARTVDTAQGATVDHSLFAPSTGASAERAYVALSRGRLTNRIYATHDRAWIGAIGRGRSHALAVDQEPDRTQHRSTHRRGVTRDREQHVPVELDL
jgi:ATP-dependent exoDNAse (exonuclease V) alpha subunit